MSFLQIFLYLNVFLIGVLATIAAQHALAHFRPHPEDHKEKHPALPAVRFSPEAREQLLQRAQENFQKVVTKSTEELQHDLVGTASELNKQLEKLGKDILDNEMKRYQAELDEFRRKAGGTVTETQQDMIEYQAKLKTQLAEEITAEKQRLIEQIDTKLADAVASFLAETLQHNVDLGAQTAYLTAQLEEHKAEFLQELGGESKTTK